MISLDASSLIADSGIQGELKDGSITVAAAPPDKPKGAVKKRRGR